MLLQLFEKKCDIAVFVIFGDKFGYTFLCSKEMHYVSDQKTGLGRSAVV